MSLPSFDRSPPPFFNKGPSPLARLAAFSVLALALMLADAHMHLMQPLRAALAALLYPAQWLALQPVQWAKESLGYMTELKTAQLTQEAARLRLAGQSMRAAQVEQLLLENQRLRGLLDLRQRQDVPATVAQVLYDATDPYSRRVIIDKGGVHGIRHGSPVMDETGVLGQVTRVYPFVSEITLLIDQAQVIPVINVRSGLRGVVHGHATARGDLLEMRYISASDDVREGDLLTTSGVDGIYAPGLPVARVLSVQAAGDSSFMRIACRPLAQPGGATQVLVLDPIELPDAAGAEPPPTHLPAPLPTNLPAQNAADAGAAKAGASDAGASAAPAAISSGQRAGTPEPATAAKATAPAAPQKADARPPAAAAPRPGASGARPAAR